MKMRQPLQKRFRVRTGQPAGIKRPPTKHGFLQPKIDTIAVDLHPLADGTVDDGNAIQVTLEQGIIDFVFNPEALFQDVPIAVYGESQKTGDGHHTGQVALAHHRIGLDGRPEQEQQAQRQNDADAQPGSPGMGEQQGLDKREHGGEIDHAVKRLPLIFTPRPVTAGEEQRQTENGGHKYQASTGGGATEDIGAGLLHRLKQVGKMIGAVEERIEQQPQHGQSQHDQGFAHRLVLQPEADHGEPEQQPGKGADQVFPGQVTALELRHGGTQHHIDDKQSGENEGLVRNEAPSLYEIDMDQAKERQQQAEIGAAGAEESEEGKAVEKESTEIAGGERIR